MTFTVIVPSNRPKEMEAFYTAWEPYFIKHKIHLVIMWDLEEPQIVFANKEHEITQLCWKDLDASRLQYIPRKTDMIRSFAFKWAYDYTQNQYFVTLDDDVRPEFMGNDIFEEYAKVFAEGAPLSEYFDVGALTSSGLQMRGFPYKDRVKKEVAVQYGGWSGTLDYDAATQLSSPRDYETFWPVVMPVPKGVAATCCIMNAAWQREYTPIMWQLPMLDGRYNRVGDIWSGLFIKKTLDAVGAVMVINGKASVEHRRASNPYNSLVKEAPSVWMNDNLWENLYDPGEQGTVYNYTGITNAAIHFFAQHDPLYAEHFKEARDEWLSLWK